MLLLPVLLLRGADAADEALKELAAEAADHGVPDLAAALAAVDSNTDHDAVALSKQV